MTVEKWIEIIVCIIAGIATATPLIVKLVKYVMLAAREKNWQKILRLVMDLMKEAEGMFDVGADRKTWVLSAVDALSDAIDYDVDKDTLSSMIDALCAMSKIVNGPDKDGGEK